MRQLNNIKWLPFLMVFTTLAIATFQYYWLDKAYEREKRSIERQTNMLFRETVAQVQATKIKIDRLDSSKEGRMAMQGEAGRERLRMAVNQKIANMMNLMVEKYKDTNHMVVHADSSGELVLSPKKQADSFRYASRSLSGRGTRLLQFLFDVDSLQDSITVKELHIVYSKRLDEQNLNVPFQISRIEPEDSDGPVYNEVTIGFQSPITFRIDLGNTTGFLLKRISATLIFSIFIVGFTILSFTLLYRNLLRQKKLAVIKNEFISNITHELKTPIATVSVAIEALRSFNATMDPEKTKEYLNISANELQRLSLLVDKVLKLSMFEKKEVELRYEMLDMQDLVREVTSSMKLQFEKCQAEVSINASGDTVLEGDRLHLVSVIFNLLDNALKYSNHNPKIDIDIQSTPTNLFLSISDNGIGIPAEYNNKVFEKFFRVPTGNLHNAKGYGLGLSYVAHVVSRHKGSIKIHSSEGNGSKFIINLPRQRA